MKCSVEGCIQTGKPVGSKDQYSLCSVHMEAWGYFRRGYNTALGKENDGRIDHKLWEKSMREFLEWCRIEIAACTFITESLESLSGKRR